MEQNKQKGYKRLMDLKNKRLQEKIKFYDDIKDEINK